jgi:phosphoribosylformimino-5-aminoimidazole carboxamide ribotide isomerase
MRLIGVIDLLAGHAVHARRGDRSQYRPVALAASVPIDGDPVALARVYVDRFQLREIYVADLDAIGGAPMQSDVLAAIASLADTWVDAGAHAVDAATRVLGTGAAQVIAGLETLNSFDDLDAMCKALGSQHVAFSLDLRNGVPMVGPGSAIEEATAEQLAARAADCGVGAIVVLDVARVGTNEGVSLDTIAAVRRVAPDVRLVAGGGIRDRRDLALLTDTGCDAALVATALIEGRI